MSFEVEPLYESSDLIGAELKLGGELGVGQDFNPGQQLTVVIADADGAVVAQGILEVGPVSFHPVKVKGEVLGMVRVHRTKPV